VVVACGYFSCQGSRLRPRATAWETGVQDVSGVIESGHRMLFQSGGLDINFDLYMILIVIGVLTILAFWTVFLTKAIRIAVENRKVRNVHSVTEADEEPVLLRVTRSWLAYSPILSVLSFVQVCLGMVCLARIQVGSGGLWSAAFAIYSLIFIVMQWLYFELTSVSVTPTQVVWRRGLFVEQRDNFSLQEITDVRALPPQNSWEREFGVGTLTVEAKAVRIDAFTLDAIPDPDGVKICIETARLRLAS